MTTPFSLDPGDQGFKQNYTTDLFYSKKNYLSINYFLFSEIWHSRLYKVMQEKKTTPIFQHPWSQGRKQNTRYKTAPQAIYNAKELII